MNVHFPAPRRKWPSRLMNLAVVVVVLALAAATFVLSYPGLHAIVSQAGVSARLARIYPGLFDAVFVVACVAAVMLRDGRWWARCYAWLVIILVVAVVGAADAAHAMNVTLPHRETEGAVAAAPWALVLLGFSLMLTMLRQSLAQHVATKAPAPAATPRQGAPEPAREPETAALIPEAALVPRGASVLDAFAPEAGAVREEPVRAAGPDEEPAAEQGSATAAGEADLAAHPTAATSQETVAGLDGSGATPVYGHWEGDEEPGAAGTGHPPTVPGQVIDDDAPPFATAPFATVPRLNRVRSTPMPPEGDDEE
jgi:Protein of unknown function (DUF2637)